MLVIFGSESFFKRFCSFDFMSFDKSYFFMGSYSFLLMLYRIVILLFLVVCIVLFVVVIFLFFLIFDFRNKFDDEIEGYGGVLGRFCVFCVDLKFGLFFEDNEYLIKLSKKMVNGVEVCCGSFFN